MYDSNQYLDLAAKCRARAHDAPPWLRSEYLALASEYEETARRVRRAGINRSFSASTARQLPPRSMGPITSSLGQIERKHVCPPVVQTGA